MNSEQPLKFVVFVELPGSDTTRIKCSRDSEHDARSDAYARLRVVLPANPGRLAWIETFYSVPFTLDSRRYLELSQ